MVKENEPTLLPAAPDSLSKLEKIQTVFLCMDARFKEKAKGRLLPVIISQWPHRKIWRRTIVLAATGYKTQSYTFTRFGDTTLSHFNLGTASSQMLPSWRNILYVLSNVNNCKTAKRCVLVPSPDALTVTSKGHFVKPVNLLQHITGERETTTRAPVTVKGDFYFEKTGSYFRCRRC